MKIITLLHGEQVKVDDGNYEFLSRFKWYLSNGYTYTSLSGKPISMHTLIMNTPKGKHTDHIDHDKLNNQRVNLRIVSPKENILHRRSYTGKANPFYDKRHSEDFKKSVSIRCSKTVRQFTLQGVLVAEFPNTLTAERLTGISNGNISSVCRDLRQSAGGYKWKYVNTRS